MPRLTTDATQVFAVMLFVCGACGDDPDPRVHIDASLDGGTDAAAPPVDAMLVDLPVGAECESNEQCANGICFDISSVDTGCLCRVCTVECLTNETCPDVAPEPDCEAVGGTRLCLYGGWEARFCGP